MKKLILIALALSLVTLAAAPGQTPSHPLSHIHPTDTDFNMSNYRLYNASELSVRNGFTFDNFTVYEDQTNVPILNYRESNSSWVINNSDIEMNGNNISEFFDSRCRDGYLVDAVNDDGTYNCTSINTTASDIFVEEAGDEMDGDLNFTSADINDVRNITNFFQDNCGTGQVVRRVYEDGSYECVNVTESDEFAQNLSEVLNIGNRAGNFNINMTQQNISGINTLVFDDSNSTIQDDNTDFDLDSGSANNLNLLTDGNQVASLTGTGGTQEVLLQRQLLLEDRDGDALANFSRDGPITFYNSVNNNEILRLNSSGGSEIEIPSGNIDLEDNNLIDIENLYRNDSQGNFFQNKCGEFRAVKGIYPNGTYKCTDEILEEKTEYLNETLEAGNSAGDNNILMNGSNLVLEGGYLSNDTDDDGLRLDDSGRLGINTLPETGIGLKTSGPAKLNSAVEAGTSIEGSPNTLSFISDSNAVINGRESFTDSANNITFENPNQAPLIFQTDSNERFRISGTGQLDSRNDLNLSGNDIKLDGSVKFYEGGNVTGSTGSEDNLVLQDEQGERAVAVDRDGIVDIPQNDLNLSENKLDNARRINFENGAENGYIKELSSGELGINSEGEILRLQDSSSTEISAESNVRLNENDLEQVGEIVINDNDSSGSDFTVRENNNGEFVLENGSTQRLQIDKNVSLPNDDLDLNGNDIYDISRLYENDSEGNFFDEACGEFRALKGINSNGTFVCTDRILEEKTEYLNETLEAGNTAGDNDIYMNQSQIFHIGNERTNFTNSGGLEMGGDINLSDLNVEEINEINPTGNNLQVGASQTDFGDNQIDNISKIGVKTDSPNENLDVEGSANISSSGTSMNVKDNGNVVVTLG